MTILRPVNWLPRPTAEGQVFTADANLRGSWQSASGGGGFGLTLVEIEAAVHAAAGNLYSADLTAGEDGDWGSCTLPDGTNGTSRSLYDRLGFLVGTDDVGSLGGVNVPRRIKLLNRDASPALINGVSGAGALGEPYHLAMQGEAIILQWLGGNIGWWVEVDGRKRFRCELSADTSTATTSGNWKELNLNVPGNEQGDMSAPGGGRLSCMRAGRYWVCAGQWDYPLTNSYLYQVAPCLNGSPVTSLQTSSYAVSGFAPQNLMVPMGLSYLDTIGTALRQAAGSLNFDNGYLRVEEVLP